MALGEFELIRRFFHRAGAGNGDDCAALLPSPGQQWLVSTDMLVEGRHFLSTVDPHALGHKALAVNLSDLAACGAAPRAFFLALALPQADADWLAMALSGLPPVRCGVCSSSPTRTASCWRAATPRAARSICASP